MFKVTNGPDKVEVWFHHKICGPCEIESETGANVDESRRCTYAYVSLNRRFSNRGMAVCNPRDNFCRATGRKKSLPYAIQHFSQELRKAIWDEYEVQFGF